MRMNLFLNGTLSEPDKLAAYIRPDDINIAVDGGARHCWDLNLTPDIAIGDFDSLDEEEMVRLLQAGVEIITHPKEKDQTDLELAIELAIARGAEEIVIFAGLGQRGDMTLANLLLLAHPDFRNFNIRFQEAGQNIFCIHNQVVFTGNIGDTVSLLPVGGDVEAITTTGLKYPLFDETLYFAASRGVSNLITHEQIEIKIKKGTLLCFVSAQETISKEIN